MSTGQSALVEGNVCREIGNSPLQPVFGPREEVERLRKTRPLRLRRTTPWARLPPPRAHGDTIVVYSHK